MNVIYGSTVKPTCRAAARWRRSAVTNSVSPARRAVARWSASFVRTSTGGTAKRHWRNNAEVSPCAMTGHSPRRSSITCWSGEPARAVRPCCRKSASRASHSRRDVCGDFCAAVATILDCSQCRRLSCCVGGRELTALSISSNVLMQDYATPWRRWQAGQPPSRLILLRNFPVVLCTALQSHDDDSRVELGAANDKSQVRLTIPSCVKNWQMQKPGLHRWA